jgi:uncharacterized phage-associated protein
MDIVHNPKLSTQLPPTKHIFKSRLNRDRALAAAKYLLSRLGGRHNFTALLKILFFADRYHIRRYIRPVTSDYYVAMSKGPVASFLYDVFKGSYPDIKEIVRLDWDVELHGADDTLGELAKSDKEALDFALTHFGKFNYGKLIELSHEYPEWKSYAERFKKDKDGHEPVFIEDFFDDPLPTNMTFKREKFVDPFDKIDLEEKVELIDDALEYAASIVPSYYGAQSW